MQWTTPFRSFCAVACASAFYFASPVALGQDQAPAPEAEHIDPVRAEALKALQRGPATVKLRDQGELRLPEGYGYIPTREAAAVMSAMGNQTDDRFIGLVIPLADENADWIVSVDYEPSGYIKDDDAKDWNAKELLESLQEGTEAGNKHREKMGVPPIVVSRWIEPPAYDAPTHRLVWSAEAKLKNGNDPDPTINYNTYVLGREGYISLNLITVTSAIDSDKHVARELLGATEFDAGKRYADFNSSTDKVAAYGLAALIGGVAAKKLGLLAAAGVFIAKFAKVIFIGIAALGGGIAKWFKGRSASES